MKQLGTKQVIRVVGHVFPDDPYQYSFDIDYTFIVPVDADLFTAAKEILAARHPHCRVDIAKVERLGSFEVWGE